MADIRPKIETNALGDDFAAAKHEDPHVRCSLAPAFDHLSKSLDEAKAFNRVCHHGITGRISERFLAVRQGFKSWRIRENRSFSRFRSSRCIQPRSRLACER